MNYGTTQALQTPEFGVYGGTGSAANKEAQRLPMPELPASESIVGGQPNTGFSEAAVASFKENTLMGLVFDPFSYDDSHYNADTTFDVNQAITQYTKVKGVSLDKDEMEFLTKAVSPENFYARVARWQKKQDNQKLMQGSTLGTIAGALVDPLDFVIGGGVGKLKALSRVEQVMAAGAISGAVSVATPNTLDNKDVLLNMLGPMVGAAISYKVPFDLKKTIPDAPKNKIEAANWMTKTFEYFRGWQSLNDSVAGLGAKGSALVSKVFGRAWEDEAMSATAYTRNFMTGMQRQIKEVETVLTKHGLFTRWDPRPWVRADIRKQREAVGIQVQEWLHASRKSEMAGAGELPLPTDPVVREIIEAYQKSNFATDALRRAKEAGVEGAIGKITPEPVVWDEAATEALRNSHEVFGSVDRQNIHSFSMLYTDMMNRTILPKYYKARKEVNAMLDEGKQVDFHQYLKDNTKLSDKDIQDMTAYDMASKTWFKSIASNVLEGEDPKAVMKLWRDTYDKLKQQKWDEAYAKAQKEGVFATRNYAGIVWNYDRVRDFMLRSGKSLDEVAEAFGKQIVKSIGHFAGSDAKGIGKQFLKSIQGEETGDLALKFSEWQTNGLTRDEIVATLRGAGIPDPQILRAVDNMFGNPNMNSVGDVTKSLRQRLDWDLSEDMGGFKLSQFLEPDIHKTMNRYALEMSSRIGLAKVGYRSGGDFQKALDEVADEAFAAGKSPAEVRRILDHARELALGRPTGEYVPDTVRSLLALGSALVLKNSGIYNIGEYAALAAEYGVKQVVQEFLPALRRSTIKDLSAKEAEELQDLITGQLVADGRFRPVVSYMEDNFEGAVDSVHESIQYAAQSVRFLNGSEAVRIHQVKIFASLYQKRLEDAIKGVGDARDVLLREGLPPEVLEQVQREFTKHGWIMDSWNPSVVDEISTHALSMADTSVLALRAGEKPILMDTTLGKVIFPFMSFVFAAHNKLLRRQFNRDGVVGVAKILLYQTPLAVLAASAANIAGGKEWDEDMGNGVPKAMSALGLASIPWDLIYRGRMGSGFAGFAPINSAMELLSGQDSIRGVSENIPFVAPLLPWNMALGVLESNEDK